MEPAGPEVLGIDFGTSNTVAVLASPGRPPRVISIDGTGWVPSAIFVEDDGTVTVGRDAERKARLAPERFEANPKRRIDDGDILLGVRVVPVVDAIASVLRRVGEEARRQLNGRAPDAVHLTHPAQWGASRQNVLLAAARSAGLGPNITLIPEPVAAAAHFASLPGKALPHGSALAVYDLGGGTFDCAVVASSPNGYAVLAESGLADVGGVDFDQAIVDHLGRTVSADDPARWQALSRPRTAGDRRANRALREDVRAAKETLSRYAQTDLPMPEPFEDTLLTRKEFDGLVRPVLTRTVDVLADTVRRSGTPPERLAGVYLVGGSSRIPLIASLISDRLGIVATTLDQPETAVAMGAALAPAGARPSGQTAVVLGGPPAGAPQGPPSGPSSVPGPVRPVMGGVPGPAVGGPGGPGQRPPVTGAMAAPGYPGHPGPAPQRPPVQPDPPRRSRSMLYALLAAAAVVIIATVVTIVVVNSGGNSAGKQTTTTPPSTSAPVTSGSEPVTSGSGPITSGPVTSEGPVSCELEPAADTGITPCMQQFLGEKVASSAALCTDDLSAYPDAQKQIDSIAPEAFTVCVFSSEGKALVAILVQMESQEKADEMFDKERRSIGGTAEAWSRAGASGQFASGVLLGGEPEIVWSFDAVPLVGVLTGAPGTGVTGDILKNYWEGVILPA